jgi:hypothetical protein
MSEATAVQEPPFEKQFAAIVAEMATHAHGSQKLPVLRQLLKTKLDNTKRREFLAPRLVRDAILWAEKKDAQWETDELRNKNKFPFLQGDIISTTMVLALGSSESTQTHGLWMVMSPDCDCVRGEYVRVAPVFPVAKDETSSPEFAKLNVAFTLNSPKYFPLPPNIIPNSGDLAGHFADFVTPYFLRRGDVGAAAQVASLQTDAWHILNAVLQDVTTRALDLAEALSLRS